jgi:hypothetical protein
MECKGLYNVVERLDEGFLTRHRGGKSWDLIRTGSEVVSGTRDAWDALRRFIQKNDFTRKAVYEEVQRMVDLENFTAYVIINLWAQNHDWPHNNWYAARERVEGARWIFIEWDAEWGMGLTPESYTADSYAFMMSRPAQIRDLFVGLLQNEEYRKFYKSEVARHLGGALKAENVLKHINLQAAAVTPLIPLELRTNARGFDFRLWQRNVELLRQFAARRGPYFARLTDRALNRL